MLWAIIEAPMHGWSSPPVIVAGVAGLVVLTTFVTWEARSSHPMLKLRFFRRRSFSAAIAAVAMLMFAALGGLFVRTQFLQFQLGYSPLQASVRLLPLASGMAIVAPFSPVLVRRLGTKLTVAPGLLLTAGACCRSPAPRSRRPTRGSLRA